MTTRIWIQDLRLDRGAFALTSSNHDANLFSATSVAFVKRWQGRLSHDGGRPKVEAEA